ncbi:MAG TPA: 7-cyano-7-deazaguanine synthase QueC [Phycisphaerales bacterium]|nr:7-cyano-7-deazaguanine synthase QueC [Phycisphaerales bacterium]HRQ76889.1 7-cyano-7-deazaguanine synthase QueC [Phycisphaerales bacterium]
MNASPRSAVVLLSGGLDSATTLAIAREQGFTCAALSFDYGQRHRFELEAASNVAKRLGAVEHLVMKIDLRAFGGSALTAEIDVPKDRGVATPSVQHDGEPEDIPVTYVPARNTIFLAFALGFAEVRNATDIFIGVNAIDYSGYPDCRPAFIAAFERVANLATRIGVEHAASHEPPIRIHAPLIDLTKAEIIRRGIALGVDYGLTFSCYDPNPRTGAPCRHCDSCLLRAAGFREAGIADPA